MSDEMTTNTTTSVATTPAMSAEPSVASSEHPQKSELVAIAVGVAGWLVPGLGHGLQKMWGRAVGCFLTVGVLVLLGVGMRGTCSAQKEVTHSEC